MNAIKFRPEFPIGFGRTDVSTASPPFYITPLMAAFVSVGFSFPMISKIFEVDKFGAELDLGPHGKKIEPRKQEILKAMEAGHLEMHERYLFPVEMRHTTFAQFEKWANIHRWALPEWMRTSEYAVLDPLEAGNPEVNHEIPGPVSELSAKTESEFALPDPTKAIVTPNLAAGQITQASIGIASDPNDLAGDLELSSRSSAVLQKPTSSPENSDRLATRKTKEELLAFVSDTKNLTTQGTNRIRSSAEIARAFHKYIMSPEYTGSLVDRPPSFRRIENLLSKLRREGQWKPLSPRRERES